MCKLTAGTYLKVLYFSKMKYLAICNENFSRVLNSSLGQLLLDLPSLKLLFRIFISAHKFSSILLIRKVGSVPTAKVLKTPVFVLLIINICPLSS